MARNCEKTIVVKVGNMKFPQQIKGFDPSQEMDLEEMIGMCQNLIVLDFYVYKTT